MHLRFVAARCLRGHPPLSLTTLHVISLSGNISPLTHNEQHCHIAAEAEKGGIRVKEETSHWGFVLPHASHTSEQQCRQVAWTSLCNGQMFVGESES